MQQLPIFVSVGILVVRNTAQSIVPPSSTIGYTSCTTGEPCQINCDGKWCREYNIDATRATSLILHCTEFYSCGLIKVECPTTDGASCSIYCHSRQSCAGMHVVIANNNKMNELDIQCTGDYGCYQMLVELNTTEVELVNINCMGQQSCQDAEFMVDSTKYLNLDCHGNYACARTWIYCPYKDIGGCHIDCSSGDYSCLSAYIYVSASYVYGYVDLDCLSINGSIIHHVPNSCNRLHVVCSNNAPNVWSYPSSITYIYNDTNSGDYECSNSGEFWCCPDQPTSSESTSSVSNADVNIGTSYGWSWVWAAITAFPLFIVTGSVWFIYLFCRLRFKGIECKAMITKKHEKSRRVKSGKHGSRIVVDKYFDIKYGINNMTNIYEIREITIDVDTKYYGNYNVNDIIDIKYLLFNNNIDRNHILKAEVDYDCALPCYLCKISPCILCLAFLVFMYWLSLYQGVDGINDVLPPIFIFINSLILLICCICIRCPSFYKIDDKWVINSNVVTKDEYDLFTKKLNGNNNESGVSIQMTHTLGDTERIHIMGEDNFVE